MRIFLFFLLSLLFCAACWFFRLVCCLLVLLSPSPSAARRPFRLASRPHAPKGTYLCLHAYSARFQGIPLRPGHYDVVRRNARFSSHHHQPIFYFILFFISSCSRSNNNGLFPETVRSHSHSFFFFFFAKNSSRGIPTVTRENASRST